MRVALGGALGDTHHVGDLLVGLRLLEAQHEGETMLRSKTRQRCHQVTHQQSMLGLPVRSRFAGRDDPCAAPGSRVDVERLGPRRRSASIAVLWAIRNSQGEKRRRWSNVSSCRNALRNVSCASSSATPGSWTRRAITLKTGRSYRRSSPAQASCWPASASRTSRSSLTDTSSLPGGGPTPPRRQGRRPGALRLRQGDGPAASVQRRPTWARCWSNRS